MYDQAGLIREFVKWDYELRNGEQLETVVDRALAIAESEPRGPVYLSLPREVLAAPAAAGHASTTSRLRPAARAVPDNAAIEIAAEWFAEAERPLIIAANARRDPGRLCRAGSFCRAICDSRSRNTSRDTYACARRIR